MSEAEDHNLLVGIAIVGMAGRFPGAKNIDEYWRNLRDGVESVSTLTDEELLAAGVNPASLNDPAYVKAAAILDDIEMFDGTFFGFNPREAEITDPQHRLFLECAWEALEASGYDPAKYPGRVGVYAGAGMNTYLLSNLMPHLSLDNQADIFQTLIGNDKDYLSTRVSYKLNLKGPSLTVQTACSTSLVAIHLACQSLLNYHCDIALAGGVRITVPQKSGHMYQEGGINSPDGHCRPFDAQAKGTLGGNGVGIVLLKRLDEALADGDIIHAVIRGSAINNDGSLKVGYTAPGLDGQSEVIVEAQAIAGVSADSISYVEAHGTATSLGDPIEVAALSQAFRASTSRSHFCAIGSVKSNFGHLDAAAGVAGLIKTVLALKHRQLPPTLHFTAPNPEIDFASSPFFVNRELTDWETQGDAPRRAGVSSFGIGGTNAHVVVEESPEQAVAPSSRGWHLLVLSGRTAEAVTAATEKLRRHLEAHRDISLADVAYTLQVGRREFGQRRAVVCRDVEEAIEALSQPAHWIEGTATVSPSSGVGGSGVSGIRSSSGHGAVLMYSGQGAQYVGMGRELYEREAVFRQTVDECAAALKAAQGYDLREILYPAPGREEEAAARLLQTEVTQPALFVLEYALTRVWQGWGLRIEALMGHSVGEYVAACVAGVMSVADAVRMVGRRGRLMQGMERGAMLAVRLSEAEIEAWLREWEQSQIESSEQSESATSEQGLWIAAVNGPQQCVLSGSESAIAQAEARLTEAGVGVKRLATSHAFHSGMMQGAAQTLSAEMEGVARGNINIPYISNVSGKWAQAEEVRGGEYWGRQMLAGVQWWRGVEEVLSGGAEVLLEVGPGESLKAAVREAVRGRGVEVLSTLGGKRGAKGVEAERGMVERLGEMWVRGVGVKWGGMYEGEARRRVELPTYEFERERYWVEARGGEIGDGRRGESGEGAGRKEAEVGKWLYVPVWKQSVGKLGRGAEKASERVIGEAAGAKDVAEVKESGVAQRVEGGRKWLVLREESDLSEELVARLEAAGADVVSVRRGSRYEREGEKQYVVKGESREEYERLVEELEKQGWRAEQVVHLWSVTGAEEESGGEVHGGSEGTWRGGGEGVAERVAEFERMLGRSFYSLLFLAQALGKQVLSESLEEQKKAARIQIAIVSSNMQSVSGEEELQPEKATVLGPCRVIGQEYPHINCRSIDVAFDGRRRAGQQALTVGQLLDELLSESEERIVAYRGRYRWVQTYEPVKLDRRERDARPVRLRERGAYVITGGLGGVGLVLAEHLVDVAQARLVLLGRSAFPERAEWEQWLESHEENDAVSVKIRKLQRLEEKGGEVFVAQVDVADPEQMQKVWEQARGRFGSLHGVIHAAGNPPEGLIQLKTRERASEVLSPKVRGTVVLDSLCRDEGLDFIVLCSSISSIVALPGRVDYCAANAFLDAYAHAKNAAGDTFTVSINWDGWEEVGMSVAATVRPDAQPQEYSVEGMLSSEGVEVFDRILSGDLPQVIVSVENLQARVRRHDAITAEASLEQLERQRVAVPTHARPHLRNEYVAPRNEVERIIADIWQTMLGIEMVGVEDNFFELGGDSILSIQIIARANQAGLHLTPKQVFEHQTIAELAAVEGKGKAAAAVEQGIVSGEAPLTPIQHWFFEQQTAELHHYNQASMLNVRQKLDVPMLKQVIAGLLEHHDALRLRFEQTDGGWRQRHIEPEASASEEVFRYIDLGGVAEAEQPAAITAAAEEVQRSLNPADGPVLRVALMDLGEGREGRLLIVIHHLVIDAISWRILLEDLQRGYEQLQRGEAVNFLAKTTSYKSWAEALYKQAQAEVIKGELDYWLEGTRHTPDALPVDYPQGLNTAAVERSIDVELDAELTRQLLQDVPASFNTQINEVLLTALAQAFEQWSGSASLVVDIEGHGREEITEGIDVSRTVGWFTTIYPVLLEAGTQERLGETLARTRERLRAMPRRGIGYGMLKYLNADPAVFEPLRKTRNPEVSFLYLGQYEQPLAQLELFAQAEESHGMTQGGAIRRPHLIDFSVYVANGQLQITLAYSEQLHRRETIERLAQNYLDALQSLIAFCLSTEETHFTSSDFSEFGWDQQDLDAILSKIDGPTF